LEIIPPGEKAVLVTWRPIEPPFPSPKTSTDCNKSGRIRQRGLRARLWGMVIFSEISLIALKNDFKTHRSRRNFPLQVDPPIDFYLPVTRTNQMGSKSRQAANVWRRAAVNWRRPSWPQ
jgi:hypothetical protein